MNPFKKLANWYFSKKALPYWCILILDMVVLLIAGLFTYFIFIYRRQVEVDIWLLVKTLCMYVVPSLVGARMFHTYAGIVRYSSFVDLMHVAYANGVSLAVAYAWHYFIYRFPTDMFYHLHFRHIVLMYVIGTALMWGVRALVKTLYDVAMTDGWAMRTLIYGVQEGGIGLAKNIRTQSPKHFVVKGFIAPDNSYKHNLVMGEKVYSAADDLESVINRQKIKAVLVSPLQTENFRNNPDLQDKLLASGVKIFMAQGAKEVNVDH